MGKILNIIVIETNGIVGYDCIQSLFKDDKTCVVTSATSLPSNLSYYDVVVLNNIDLSSPAIQVNPRRLEEYVKNGGGFFAIHDSTFIRPGFEGVLSLLGLQLAFDGLFINPLPNDGQQLTLIIALGDPNNPLFSFPVKPAVSMQPHPIINKLSTFNLNDEFWAMNISADVKPLLYAEVGDRIPGTLARLKKSSIVAGCRNVLKGRCVFLLLGHFPQTYSNSNIQRFMTNAVLWAGKLINASPWAYDIFISFSSKDERKAQQIAKYAKN